MKFPQNIITEIKHPLIDNKMRAFMTNNSPMYPDIFFYTHTDGKMFASTNVKLKGKDGKWYIRNLIAAESTLSLNKQDLFHILKKDYEHTIKYDFGIPEFDIEIKTA